jgi:predicted XRE-type DNA-binding protein
MRNAHNETNKPGHVTKGDVFEDLGLSRAEVFEAKVKAELWRDLIAHIKPLALAQKELARRLGIHQPEVSNLLNAKLSKFSAGTLIHYAVKLDLDVQVKLIAPRPKNAVVKTFPARVRGKSHHYGLELAAAAAIAR